MEYVNASGKVYRRVVSLEGLTAKMFEAFCHSSDEVRTFRKDRVLAMVLPTGKSVVPDEMWHVFQAWLDLHDEEPFYEEWQ